MIYINGKSINNTSNSNHIEDCTSAATRESIPGCCACSFFLTFGLLSILALRSFDRCGKENFDLKLRSGLPTLAFLFRLKWCWVNFRCLNEIGNWSVSTIYLVYINSRIGNNPARASQQDECLIEFVFAKRVRFNIYRMLKCSIKISTQKPSSFIYFNLIWVSLSHTFTELYSYWLFLFLPFPQTNAVNDTHKFYWAYQLEAYITATFNVCISFFIHSTWQWSCCKTLFIKIAHIRNVSIHLELTNFIDIDS